MTLLTCWYTWAENILQKILWITIENICRRRKCKSYQNNNKANIDIVVILPSMEGRSSLLDIIVLFSIIQSANKST